MGLPALCTLTVQTMGVGCCVLWCFVAALIQVQTVLLNAENSSNLRVKNMENTSKQVVGAVQESQVLAGCGVAEGLIAPVCIVRFQR